MVNKINYDLCKKCEWLELMKFKSGEQYCFLAESSDSMPLNRGKPVKTFIVPEKCPYFLEHLVSGKKC